MPPVLFVGETTVMPGGAAHREDFIQFIALSTEDLVEGAQISIGWLHSRPEERRPTRFRDRLQ